MELILIHPDPPCDVDPRNIHGDTPLHLAVKAAIDSEDRDQEFHVVRSLLDAGADITCVVVRTTPTRTGLLKCPTQDKE